MEKNQSKNSEAMLQSIIDSTDDLIFLKDENFIYLNCNDAFTKFVGKSKDDIIDSSDFDLFDNNTASFFREKDIEMLKSNKIRSNYEWIKYQDEKNVYLHTQKIPFKYDEDSIGVLGISRDATELHLVQKKLEAQAYIDNLTQIYNRKSYHEHVNKLLSQFSRYDTTFSMMMFDLDDFKKINDIHGHHLGDKILIEISKLIKSHIRNSDYLFRIGGEEFVILFTETSIYEAEIVAENIRISVENDLKTLKDEKVTISIGLTEVERNDTEDLIYKRADGLLYYSKINGKNMVSTKIFGDLEYAYYFDDQTSTIYERISGTFMNIDAFKDTFMNIEFVNKYSTYENIITDFRDFDMNFEYFESEAVEVLIKLKENLLHNDLSIKRAVSLIHKYTNNDPIKEVLTDLGVKTNNFNNIPDISEFIGFDTVKYFKMKDSQLTVCR